MERKEQAELERLAARVYRAYRTLPGAPEGRVEPELLARELLGLRVEYRRLSRDGSILGLTAAAPVGIPVEEDGKPVHYYLDGRTVLLDSSLLSPWANEGRRRFTLAHEVSHQLLARRAGCRRVFCLRNGGPETPAEQQANLLASALLMPEPLLRPALSAFGLRGCSGVPDRRLDPETWKRCAALAKTLGVSRSALSLRLGSPAADRPRRRLSAGSIPEVQMDGRDRERLGGPPPPAD